MDQQTLISIIVIGLVTVSGLAYSIKKKTLRGLAIDYIVKAEEIFNKGENEEKLNFVIQNIRAKLPALIKPFVTVTVIKDFVNTVFDEIKKALDYQEEK